MGQVGRNLKSAEIRTLFLTFFERRGHKVIPSSSLIPYGDHPAVYQCRDGPVQRCVLGLQPRPYPRAVTAEVHQGRG